ncbi:hypothetical protein AX774_g6399 [Zancudomyces culisetae]|uniref:Uncharacterized protein n=1 Tax=Zancudomyces culisetae TaxID=1213189 RepID=A0A1R1PGS4_ZANCU|nr:hypothetical protein AX774_g6399 [Zancudomyces culisetae]|eukprot:OMH80176.1 hypothetical protein AX774_g6399 [Zancudomyces culisetae]
MALTILFDVWVLRFRFPGNSYFLFLFLFLFFNFPFHFPDIHPYTLMYTSSAIRILIFHIYATSCTRCHSVFILFPSDCVFDNFGFVLFYSNIARSALTSPQ